MNARAAWFENGIRSGADRRAEHKNVHDADLFASHSSFMNSKEKLPPGYEGWSRNPGCQTSRSPATNFSFARRAYRSGDVLKPPAKLHSCGDTLESNSARIPAKLESSPAVDTRVR